MAFGFTNGVQPSVGSLKVQYVEQTRNAENVLGPASETEIETTDCGSKIDNWMAKPFKFSEVETVSNVTESSVVPKTVHY